MDPRTVSERVRFFDYSGASFLAHGQKSLVMELSRIQFNDMEVVTL